MEIISETFDKLVNSIFTVSSMITVYDIIDIAIVSFILYKVFQFLRKSTAFGVVKGVFLLVIVLVVSELLRLHVVNFILASTFQVGIIAIVILFQPELRRILEQMGSSGLSGMLNRGQVGNMEFTIMQTVETCIDMSKIKEGVLIVFERKTQLSDIIKTGTVIDALASAELLKNIFYPKAPLHDGAVIIRSAKVAGAGCMLPLTNNPNLSKELGMRHRAAIGMSEKSDAIAVVVSEETGSISVAHDGMLKRHLAPDTLEKLLRAELLPKDEGDDKRGIKRWFSGGKDKE